MKQLLSNGQVLIASTPAFRNSHTRDAWPTHATVFYSFGTAYNLAGDYIAYGDFVLKDGTEFFYLFPGVSTFDAIQDILQSIFLYNPGKPPLFWYGEGWNYIGRHQVIQKLTASEFYANWLT